jgi:hypothetical protein
MSRQIHLDANYVIRSQDPRDLRRIKSHEDSGSADVNCCPGKFHSLCRDQAHAAAQPQAETASASPFNRSLVSFSDLLEPAAVGMCCRHGCPLRPCGPPIVLARDGPEHYARDGPEQNLGYFQRLRPLSQRGLAGIHRSRNAKAAPETRNLPARNLRIPAQSRHWTVLLGAGQRRWNINSAGSNTACYDGNRCSENRQLLAGS